MPPRRPTLTMRPRIFGGVEILVGDACRNLIDDEVDALAAGRLLDLFRPAGIAEVEGEAQPYSPSRARRAGLVEVPITIDAPISLPICKPIRPTPVLAPWISSVSPRLRRPAVTDPHCAWSAAPTGKQAACANVMLSGDAMQAHIVGDDIFRVGARRRAHHPVARRDAYRLAADRLHLAGAFEPDARALAAHRAVLMAGGDRRSGAVERGGTNADQDLVRLRRGLRHLADLDTGLTEDRTASWGVSGRRCRWICARRRGRGAAAPGLTTIFAEGRAACGGGGRSVRRQTRVIPRPRRGGGTRIHL